MRGFRVLAFAAGLLVGLVSAQSSITPTLSAGPTYQPSVPWTIPTASTPCSAGSTATATGGYGGGVYQDVFGGYWEVECGYAWTGTTYYDGVNSGPGGSAVIGTTSQGVFACFESCAQRVGCVAFEFFGYSTNTMVGSGQCVYVFLKMSHWQTAANVDLQQLLQRKPGIPVLQR